MAKVIKHKGRLVGWTPAQIKAFKLVTTGTLKGKRVYRTSIDPRVRKVLLGRRLVMELGIQLLLTNAGEAVARSCGWWKNPTPPPYI